MKLRKHGKFLLDFVTAYADGKMERREFDLDYSGYVIEHFPGFEDESPRLAAQFSATIDCAYDFGEKLPNASHREAIACALGEFLGTTMLPDIS